MLPPFPKLESDLLCEFATYRTGIEVAAWWQLNPQFSGEAEVSMKKLKYH